jgi:hypothetical protein
MSRTDLERVNRAYERTQSAEKALREARRELREGMRRARGSGDSLATIGRAAGGISRQGVDEILGD